MASRVKIGDRTNVVRGAVDQCTSCASANCMDLSQISDKTRLDFARTIAAYGTHDPTIEQRIPNLKFRYSAEHDHPEGPMYVYKDTADESLIFSGEDLGVGSQ